MAEAIQVAHIGSKPALAGQGMEPGGKALRLGLLAVHHPGEGPVQKEAGGAYPLKELLAHDERQTGLGSWLLRKLRLPLP